MRPFGCPVTILNTLDPIGKFNGKSNEGFFVGYFLNSKAVRVFNTRTRKVEENLHITFLENKPNVVGSGPDWLFDIDLLTNSINYEPITTGNQTNKNAGIKDNTQQFILLPLLYNSPKSSEDAVTDDAGKKTNEKPTNEGERNCQKKEGGASNKKDDQNMQDFRAALDNLLMQQKEGYANSTKRDSTVSPSVSIAGQSFTNADDLPIDPLMPDLEDTTDLLNTGIFSAAYDNEDVGAEADLNKLETTMNVSLIPTTRIHKDRPKDQIIRDINSATQTRRMIKISEELVMIVFLYGTIEEEVYVCQPPGFEDPQFPNKVYKVEKALYGLHQAPRAWYETLSTYLSENGFRRGIIDKTLFIKKDKGDTLLVQVYVDDIIYGSTKKSLCVEFESLMHKKFRMSSIGELTFFLRLQVMQRDAGIFINQDKYVANILKKFDFVTMNTASTPIETHKALLKDEEAENVDVHLYRSMIRSLMYLTASRPDIMFDVCACARFKVTPKVSHLHVVKTIFRYLKGQLKLGIWYPRDSPFDLEAFFNSDYARASLDRKFTTGCYQFLGKRLILWQCKKQTIVANFTTEAEYVAVANCCGQSRMDGRTCNIKQKCVKSQIPKRGQDTKIPQFGGPLEKVGDEAVLKDLGDRIERAATTTSSLEAEQDSGNINRTQSMATLNESFPQGTDSSSGPRCQDTILGGAEAQTKFEAASKQSNDPPLSKVNTLGSGEDNMKLKELMEFCTKLSEKALDLCDIQIERVNCTSKNGEMEITVTIDGRVKTVTEASIRRHLKLENSDGISTLPNTEIFKQLALMRVKDQQSQLKEAATMPHDSPLTRVHSLRSDEGSITLHELTVLFTTLSKKVESLESDLKLTKQTYGAAYTKLIIKVKKLENRIKSSKARRRVRLIVSENEGDLKDPSKQGRKIAKLDKDEGITLIQMGTQTQGRHEHDLEPDFNFAASEEVYTAEPDISTANVPVSTAGAEVSTVSPEVKTAAESLVYIRRSAAKRKDKSKAIMKEAGPVQKKTKLQLEQEILGYEEALRLQEQLDEEERQRIARVHKEANTFNAEEYDNIQAQIKAEMINERKRLFAQQRAEQRRNKPMTQAQQRTYMCNYIKNIGSHTLQHLKKLSIDEIKELFETTMKRVKDFVPMKSDRLVPKISTRSSKRTVKYPIIVWEVYSEDTIKYWKIIRVGNHTEAYQTFDHMLKKFDRDNLDKLYSLVKERFSSTDSTDDKERTLWVQLKRVWPFLGVVHNSSKDARLSEATSTIIRSNRENTSSTNEAGNIAHEVSTASSQGQDSSSTYANDVMFSFFANQSNSSQLDNEDLEQIDTNDLKEMDLK
ncbi:putative ribonuclease H-like domain-containing protein [Tanacetum coccineum]|uniref:Ribonuclease H-like domain-containing protein n=1 Tax=Tanacetum coccineum TaxID=301880 RepID=A0ABQ5JD30_9ASTR